MDIVKKGRKWEINSKEDYDNAIKTLEGNEFCANMSDDFYYWKTELTEIARQRADVTAQAKEKRII